MAHAIAAAFKVPLVPRAAFRAMSQIEIAYRDGPLSAGAAGTVHAGDRLPWVADAAADNFAPLRSLDWQVHVYGSAAPALRDALAARAMPLHVFPWSDGARAKGLRARRALSRAARRLHRPGRRRSRPGRDRDYLADGSSRRERRRRTARLPARSPLPQGRQEGP